MTTMEEVEEASRPRCANPDCKIASGGRCLEGFPEASACPQFGKALVIVPGTAAQSPKPSVPGVRLPHAESLSISEATALLRQRPCNVISLVGPFDSGKTSLVAGMYDLLQRGPVGGYSFAGSSTMHAFERACHDSRRDSERGEAHMERTERGGVLFFHVDLVSEGCEAKQAALFGNRAGEEYSIVQDEPDRARAYPELLRSDVLTVLVDGAKLLDAGERHQVRAQVRLTLRAFIEVGVAPPWQRLALVLTKLDAIRRDEAGRDGALRYFEALVEKVQADYAAKFAEIQSFTVAASPKTTNANRGEGMPELLRYWMADPRRNAPAAIEQTEVPKERAFGKLPLLAASRASS
jgi:Double-GTPase 2